MIRKLSIKPMVRRFYRRAISRSANEISPEQNGALSLVFAPHPDDETLGCGGTIIRKTMAGGQVKVIFLTDGRQSHAHLMPPEELHALRVSEAVSACQQLGVDQNSVFFLNFKDGGLGQFADAAFQKISRIVLDHAPDEVFIPYRREHPPDHYMTAQIVLAALNRATKPVTVYEYPVWFWYHWPWVSLRNRTYREPRTFLKNSLAAGFGLRMLKDFNTAVYIGGVLDKKKQALARHASQMSRLIPDPRWLTLQDVSNGEFLDCFFQEHEIFQRYNSAGTK